MSTVTGRYAADVTFTDRTEDHFTGSYGAVLGWLIQMMGDVTRTVAAFTVGRIIVETTERELRDAMRVPVRAVNEPPGVPIGLVTPGDLGVT